MSYTRADQIQIRDVNIERIAGSLESIARSLEKLANPVVAVHATDADVVDVDFIKGDA